MFARSMSTLMIAAGLVFAGTAELALAASAGDSTTEPVGDGSSYPAYPQWNSSRTRAEVHAEMIEARRTGSMAVIGDHVNTYGEENRPSSLTRAEVRQQAHEAMMAGTLPQGESFGQ